MTKAALRARTGGKAVKPAQALNPVDYAVISQALIAAPARRTR